MGKAAPFSVSEDYYTILGVPPTATVDEIKDRFRFFSHAYHPDKFRSESHRRMAEREFQRVNEAYQVLANPRRRGEYAAVLRFYLENGIPIYDMISAGNFEGGDFNILRDGLALVGFTDHRSEEVAARQAAEWFIKEGWEIKYAPIDQFYVHIDLMVCMLNEHCAAVCPETTEDDVIAWLKAKKIEIIPATFKETMALGCNVVTLGGDRVLSTESAKDLNAKMRAAGFTVYDPDMTMFTWAGGGVHCMCQPLRREAA